jgi:signal transduction histidine kinase
MVSWRSSAAYQIAFANLGALLVGLAVLGVVVFFAMHIAFTNQLDAMISDEAQTLVDEYRGGGRHELVEAIAAREASRSPTRMLYAVFAPDGRRLEGSLQTTRPPLGLHDIVFVDPREGPDSARGLALDLSPSERLLVAADREWIERIDRTVIEVFGLAFLAACLLGLGGAVMLGNYLRRRLRSISGTAETIIGGDIRERMPVSNHRDEFDQLAITLNRMLDRIEGLLENLRQVSSDIAHDLRTPLARLRNRLEEGVLQGKSGDGVTILEDAMRSLDDVLSLFAAILRIAEVEAGETRRFFAPVDMSALVSELAESYAPALHDGGRDLLSSVEPNLTVNGDRELLAQAGINLIENAQRHTPPGTLVRLTLVAAGEFVCLRVIDDGPGVSNADLGRIVKRFARLERSRTTGGYGLGLNLVSAVAKLHGGRLLLENLGGLAATVELPRDSGGEANVEDREQSGTVKEYDE